MTMIETASDRDRTERDGHWQLFLAVDAALAPRKVLYPACRFDVSPSLVFPDVTYVDDGSDVAAFFGDIEGVLDLVAQCRTAPQDAVFRYIRADCSRLVLPRARYDLVISLDPRPVAESCAGYLKRGGWFLALPGSRDAATLADDPDFALAAVVTAPPGDDCLQMIEQGNERPAAGRPRAPISDAASLVFTRVR